MDRETMLADARAVGAMPRTRLAFQLQQRSQLTSSRTSTPSRFWLGRAPATRVVEWALPSQTSSSMRRIGSTKQNSQ